jgi:mannitol-specific phosphotransferase system IIBC component
MAPDSRRSTECKRKPTVASSRSGGTHIHYVGLHSIYLPIILYASFLSLTMALGASVAIPGASTLAFKVGDVMSNDTGVYRDVSNATSWKIVK